MRLVKLLAARLRQADETIAALAFLSLKGRIARALLTLAEDLGEATDSGALSSKLLEGNSAKEAKLAVSQGNYRRRPREPVDHGEITDDRTWS
jgi:CRP/FNR family transcriptional regulator, cyclic AMP receptor protein